MSPLTKKLAVVDYILLAVLVIGIVLPFRAIDGIYRLELFVILPCVLLLPKFTPGLGRITAPTFWGAVFFIWARRISADDVIDIQTRAVTCVFIYVFAWCIARVLHRFFRVDELSRGFNKQDRALFEKGAQQERELEETTIRRAKAWPDEEDGKTPQ